MATVELVQTKTIDGLRLDGALQMPTEAQETSKSIAILFGGVGTNFYGSRLITSIAESIRTAGYATLCVNTRGHDGVNTTATDRGGILQGAAYEIVDPCRLDVEAWVNLVSSRGFEESVLVGHSLGALKIVYADAYQHCTGVRKVIAISPPRLSYSRFQVSPRADDFRSSMLQAEQLVARNESQMLFQATFPYPLILSAATYVDKYGPAERYNLLRFANKTTANTSFLFGELELDDSNGAFHGLPTEIRDLSWETPPRIETIAQANHFYSGAQQRLNDSVVSILNS